MDLMVDRMGLDTWFVSGNHVKCYSSRPAIITLIIRDTVAWLQSLGSRYMCGSRGGGGRGSGPPLKNKKYRVSYNSIQVSLKNHKATKLGLSLARHGFAGGPMTVRL